MEINEFNKLEEKINGVVSHLKQLKEENKQLKSQIEKLKLSANLGDEEREDVKKKVNSLIELIDSLEI